MHILGSSKWRNLIGYQYFLPVAVLFVFGFYTGVSNENVKFWLAQFAFDGELTLIATFLVIGTGVELRPNFARLNKTRREEPQLILYEMWVPVIVIFMMIYVLNKQAVLECGSCIFDDQAGPGQYLFIASNIVTFMTSPFFCSAIIKVVSS